MVVSDEVLWPNVKCGNSILSLSHLANISESLGRPSLEVTVRPTPHLAWNLGLEIWLL